MTCSLPDFSLYFEASVVGADVPVLLLHSALGSCEEMRPVRALFGERSTILLDLPGHGRTTEASSATLTTEAIAAALDAFLDKLKIPQVDIVGYSLGGYVGLALAKLSPKKVRSVATHAMKFYWTPEAIENAVTTFAKAPVDARSIGAMTSIIRDFNRTQLSAEDIRRAGAPVLLTTGERDEFVTAHEVGHLWSDVKSDNASLAIFAGAGHSLRKLPLTEFDQVVREFWVGLS
jgi:pimeloyl-ACP methyl ester carboxylesterase